ncbi:MAG: hypothetical protein Q4G03_04365 [Planctomycetia bacterium]|nr:hypothetical protein [Planctomycetia bacterium]
MLKRIKETVVRTRRLTCLFGIGVVCMLLGVRAVNAADTKSENCDIYATATVASVDDLWRALDRIADEMKYSEVTQVARAALKLRGANVTFAQNRPFGLVVASNGDNVFTFGHLPLPEDEKGADSATVFTQALFDQMNDKFDLDVELLPLGNTLCIVNPKCADLIPANVADDLQTLTFSNAEDIKFIEVKVNVEKIPAEFIEAAFASLRNAIAERAAANSQIVPEELNDTLKIYSELIDSIAQCTWSITLDQENNLVSTFTLACKPDSVLLGQLEASSKMTSRWTSLLQTPNSIFSSVRAGVVTGLDAATQSNTINDVTDNQLFLMQSILDNPDDFAVAQDLLEAFRKVALANLSVNEFDTGFVVAAEPFVIELGIDVKEMVRLKEAAQKIWERFCESQPDAKDMLKFDAQAYADFQITTFDMPLNELDNVKFAYLRDKTLAVRFGLNDDAVLIVAGLDPTFCDAEFKRIAEASGTKEPYPTISSVNLAPLGMLLRSLLCEEESVNPNALKSLEALEKAQNAKFVFSQELVDSSLVCKATITNDVFKLIGDVIRINLEKQVKDAGEDLDDLFDDEE